MKRLKIKTFEKWEFHAKYSQEMDFLCAILNPLVCHGKYDVTFVDSILLLTRDLPCGQLSMVYRVSSCAHAMINGRAVRASKVISRVMIGQMRARWMHLSYLQACPWPTPVHQPSLIIPIIWYFLWIPRDPANSRLLAIGIPLWCVRDCTKYVL